MVCVALTLEDGFRGSGVGRLPYSRIISSLSCSWFFPFPLPSFPSSRIHHPGRASWGTRGENKPLSPPSAGSPEKRTKCGLVAARLGVGVARVVLPLIGCWAGKTYT